MVVSISGSGFGRFPSQHSYSFVLWWATGTETWLSAQIVSDTLMTAIVKPLRSKASRHRAQFVAVILERDSEPAFYDRP